MTENDPDGRMWTLDAPDIVAARRVHALAHATHAYLQGIESGMLDVSGMLFTRKRTTISSSNSDQLYYRVIFRIYQQFHPTGPINMPMPHTQTAWSRCDLVLTR